MDEITSFATILEKVRTHEKKTVVVADAAEPDVIAATFHAHEEKLANIIYVGDAERIRQLAGEAAAMIS